MPKFEKMRVDNLGPVELEMSRVIRFLRATFTFHPFQLFRSNKKPA